MLRNGPSGLSKASVKSKSKNPVNSSVQTSDLDQSWSSVASSSATLNLSKYKDLYWNLYGEECLKQKDALLSLNLNVKLNGDNSKSNGERYLQGNKENPLRKGKQAVKSLNDKNQQPNGSQENQLSNSLKKVQSKDKVNTPSNVKDRKPLKIKDQISNGINEKLPKKNSSPSLSVSRQGSSSNFSCSQELLNTPDVKKLYLEKYKDQLKALGQILLTNSSSVDKQINDIQEPQHKNKKRSHQNFDDNNNNKLLDVSFEICCSASKKRSLNESNDTADELCKLPILKNWDEKFSDKKQVVDKLEAVLKSRDVGLYVLCDYCNKGRYLPDVKDPTELPDKWFCYMNPDPKFNRCDVAEVVGDNYDSLILTKYNAGSIVWAKLTGHPWWPAMVDDDPRFLDYYWHDVDENEASEYYVTYFNTALRKKEGAWLNVKNIKRFNEVEPSKQVAFKKYSKAYKANFFKSVELAKNALELPLIERLQKFGTINYYIKNFNKKKERYIRSYQILM